jgi:23S rRNA (cytosine1962-C5)-methyltransferase
MTESIIKNLEIAISKRRHLFGIQKENSFRLFNGFSEGCPSIVVDVYRHTLLIYNFDKNPQSVATLIESAEEYLTEQLPWVKSVIIKTRKGDSREQKVGILSYGENADIKISENDIRYAIDLQMNQDASFYIDTRNLRSWLKKNMKDKTVLNTFAYTGSFGVAAKAGGATKVTQMDLSKRFLGLAKRSYQLNKFDIENKDFLIGDFFSCVKQFKMSKRTFDCVILDPPFFSATNKGRVDLAKNNKQLINKLRPLINDGGYLVVINNALFVSGAEFMSEIEELCSSDYLSVKEIIPIPQDVVGYPNPDVETNIQPTDTKPFNHSTKIVILKIKKK